MGNQKSKKYRRQNTTPPRPGQVEYEIQFVETKLKYISDIYKIYGGDALKQSYDTAEGLSILIEENYRCNRMVFVKNLLQQLQTLYDEVESNYKTDLERQKSTQGSSKETYDRDDFRYPDLVLTPSPPPSPQAACAQESPSQRPQSPAASASQDEGIWYTPSTKDKPRNLSSALGQPSVW